jgi:hypothetical protein
MNAGDELSIAQHFERAAPHAGHDPHVDDDVGRIGEFNADVRQRRAQGTHAEGGHIHGPSPHGAGEDPLHGDAHLARVHPIVGGAGVLPPLAADEGPILDPGDITGIGKGEVAVGALGGIKSLQGSCRHHLVQQGLVLGGRAVAPVNSIGLCEGSDFRDPFPQSLIGDPGRCIQLRHSRARLTENSHVFGSKGYRAPPFRWSARGPEISTAEGFAATERRKIARLCMSRGQGPTGTMSGGK